MTSISMMRGVDQIGGNAVIFPVVTIGNNVVIGAGSIAAKDISDNVTATGNPCRIIREITEEDRSYYFKKRKFNAESLTDMEETEHEN